MVLKKFSSEIKKIQTKQFNKFLELRCPSCGKEIDFEILVNFFSEKRRE